MPAILRKSLPKSFALITIFRPYAQNERTVGSGGSDHRVQRRQRHEELQHYAFGSVGLLVSWCEVSVAYVLCHSQQDQYGGPE